MMKLTTMPADSVALSRAISPAVPPYWRDANGRAEAPAQSGWTGLRKLRIAACIVFMVLLLAVLRSILHRNDGHLIYALDDPYIHLALSEQIAHGHYGINPAEYSSPASSIVWPFLLAPFAGHAIHVYVPLFLNILAGLSAVYLLAGLVDRAMPGAGSFAWCMRLLAVILLMFAANLVSLPFVGLEHELQVLLAIASAMGLCDAMEGRLIPAWSLVAAAAGPLVRYECLSVTVAVVVTLVAMRQMLRAALVLAGGTIPVVAFSLFLRHLGLQLLPASVLTKLGHPTSSPHVVGRLYELVRLMYHAVLDDPTRWPVVVLGLVLLGLAIWQKQRSMRVVLGASVLTALLHLLIGGFGWFHRYEVYAAAFLTVIFFYAIRKLEPLAYVALLPGLFYLASPYIVATLDTPAATQEVYRQQFQMQRFLDGYYRKDVAVNDIGLISFHRPANVYVLDLFGLAWYDAAIADRTPAWLERVVGARHIGLVMLYPDDFRAPASWTHIGELCLPQQKVLVVGHACVAFYGATATAAAEIEPELRAFVPTLPAGDTFTFGRQVSTYPRH